MCSRGSLIDQAGQPPTQPYPGQGRHSPSQQPVSQPANGAVFLSVALLYESPGGNQVDGLPPVPTCGTFALRCERSRGSTSLSGGNQVDGLPLAPVRLTIYRRRQFEWPFLWSDLSSQSHLEAPRVLRAETRLTVYCRLLN